MLTPVLWFKLATEAIGAPVIGAGMALATLRFLRSRFPPLPENFTSVRLTRARFPAIAPEFQPGADILSAAVAPSGDAIGKPGAIAVIRTVLNCFLGHEMHEEATAVEKR